MTTESPVKPDTIIPTFGVKDTMWKAPVTKAPPSKDKLRQNEAYDKFLASIPAGKVGVIQLVDALAGRSRHVQGLVRGAAKRTGISMVSVHNKDENQVEVKVK